MPRRGSASITPAERLDIATRGCPPLTEAFDATEVFAWLTEHAGRSNFVLSYPRDNPFGIVYEPWHWAMESGIRNQESVNHESGIMNRES